MSRAVDGLLADPRLGPSADGSRYLATGHSFGGITTLSLAGAIFDFDYGLEHCATADDSPAGCAFFDDTVLGDPALAQPDPRVVAGVDISPAGWYAFGESGLDDMVPLMVIGGTRDEDLSYDEEARPTMEALPAPKILVSLVDAGHWGVTDICLILAFLPDCEGADAGWMEPERAQFVIQSMVTAFAARHLLDDDSYDTWLTPEQWPGDDVVIEVTP